LEVGRGHQQRLVDLVANVPPGPSLEFVELGTTAVRAAQLEMRKSDLELARRSAEAVVSSPVVGAKLFLSSANAVLGALAHLTSDKEMAERALPEIPETNSYAIGYGQTTDHVRGLVLETLDRTDDAVEAIEAGLAFLPLAYRPFRAEAAYDCARIRLLRDAPGDRERARELIDEALSSAQDLKMKPLVEKILAIKLKDQGITTEMDIYTSIVAVADSVQRERPDIAAHAAPDGTVTIMFSDIEDSTVLTERLGDRGWQDLLHKHNALIREQLRVYGGYEVKTMGDGFMVAFRSAKKGLDCAIAIQKAFAEALTPGPSPSGGEGSKERVKVRIGLHAGEAIKDGDDFYGKNVILASRVAGKAVGGEILVSSLVRALVESSVEPGTFAEGREVELKGLSGTHTVYEVRMNEAE
jgi:class 3 adenylate cyclase